MLKLDIDDVYKKSRLRLQIILYAMPRPFAVRLSSSREGLHLAVSQCAKWDYRRYIYDDPMRIALDEQRERRGMPISNLLWDTKNGVSAGHWRCIRTEKDIESFLDCFTNTFIYLHDNEVICKK